MNICDTDRQAVSVTPNAVYRELWFLINSSRICPFDSEVRRIVTNIISKIRMKFQPANCNFITTLLVLHKGGFFLLLLVAE